MLPLLTDGNTDAPISPECDCRAVVKASLELSATEEDSAELDVACLSADVGAGKDEVADAS